MDPHQLNFPFIGLEAELLFQIEQTWGFILSPDDIKLTFPDRHGRNIALPADMEVREFLDLHRTNWTREQDLGSHFIARAFAARDQPYVFQIDCRSNEPDPLVDDP